MAAMIFPDPQTHEFPEWVLFEDYFYNAPDVVSFGEPLTVENLRQAYSAGIFPWHIDGMPLPWYCPATRAILEFSELHIPRSLERASRKNEFTFTIDKSFREVITNCSKMKRPDQHGTWITPEFIEAYCGLHETGMAHSIEAWNADGELAGGVYGVDAGGVFCGESMFHKAPNASKLALLFLIDHMQKRSATWLDVQVMTPHIEALGAREISRSVFLDKLKKVQSFDLILF